MEFRSHGEEVKVEEIVKEIGLTLLDMVPGVVLMALYLGMLHGGTISQAVSNFMTGLTG